MSVQHEDIRLVAVSKHHVELLRSTTPEDIIEGLRYVLLAYEESPPLSGELAQLFVRDLQWWRDQTRDLHEAA